MFVFLLTDTVTADKIKMKFIFVVLRRIILGIWPKSFYRATVNGLTTR